MHPSKNRRLADARGIILLFWSPKARLHESRSRQGVASRADGGEYCDTTRGKVAEKQSASLERNNAEHNR